MPILDENVDPFFQKMVAAHRGDAEAWRAVNRSLRDVMLDHAVHRVPYYREVVRPSMPWEEIPLLTKSLIRERGGEMLAEGIPEHRRVPKRTSGSTGEPTSFFRDTTQGPLEYVSAHRFLKRLHGIPDGPTKVWISNNPGTDEPRWGGVPPRRRRAGLRKVEANPPVRPVSALELSPARLREEVRRWARFEGYFLYGPASVLVWTASLLAREGIDPAAPPIAAVTTADMLTTPGEERIASVFGCPVHSWYGSHETNGYLAGTIPGTRRYLFNPLLAHVEILDEDGSPAEAGTPGRLILTDLNNYVMPMIRLDIGDVATPSKEGFVGGFPVVEDLVGRSSETLRLVNGRILTPLGLNNRLFVVRSLGEDVDAYQCLQRVPDEVELRVVWRRAPSGAVREEIQTAMREIVGEGISVRLQDVEELEQLPSGKPWIVRGLEAR